MLVGLTTRKALAVVSVRSVWFVWLMWYICFPRSLQYRYTQVTPHLVFIANGFFSFLSDDFVLFVTNWPPALSIWVLPSVICVCANVKVKLPLYLTNKALSHEDVWRRGCIDPRILDLGTSWRWVVRFTPRQLYPPGKSPQYPLDRRLGGPQSRSGRRGEKKSLAPIGTRAPTPRPSSP
jgi:hypothetical protein